MTKNSMLMQTPYFSVVEGFRQFIRNSVRTKQDHYKWVDLWHFLGSSISHSKIRRTAKTVWV